jgi:hypothetical protein
VIVIDGVNELAKRNASSGSGIEMHEQNTVYHQQVTWYALLRISDLVTWSHD